MLVLQTFMLHFHTFHICLSRNDQPYAAHLQLMGVVLLVGVPDSGDVFWEGPYKGEVSGFP